MKIIAFYHRHIRRAFALLALLCALCAFLYGFFLLEAVGHAASRARASAAVKDLKSQLSDLESRYLAATQALTPERAKALGFVAPHSVSVVYATDASHALTYAGKPLSGAAKAQ